MPQYFIYNRYDLSTLNLLESLPPEVITINFYSNYEKYSKLILPESMPCLVDELQYVTSYEIGDGVLTETEQHELDRDEMLIDLLIQQQEILLELQTQAAN